MCEKVIKRIIRSLNSKEKRSGMITRGLLLLLLHLNNVVPYLDRCLNNQELNLNIVYRLRQNPTENSPEFNQAAQRVFSLTYKSRFIFLSGLLSLLIGG